MRPMVMPPATCGPLLRGAAGAVAAIDAILLAAFEDRMFGDDGAEIEDTDQIGQLLDLDDAAGAIGHAVIVAADGDEAVVADAALELEHGIEGMLGQGLQFGLLGGEGFGDDALRRAVDADIGDGVEPVDQLVRSDRRGCGRRGPGRSPGGYS